VWPPCSGSWPSIDQRVVGVTLAKHIYELAVDLSGDDGPLIDNHDEFAPSKGISPAWWKRYSQSMVTFLGEFH
jgi:hypothetical protein